MTKVIPLPEGYQVGQRVLTNARYTAINLHQTKPRGGIIVNGSRSQDGPVMIHLDGHRHARALTTNLFDVVVS
jgi:hypothetical protein